MEKRLAKIIASVSSAYCLLVIIIEVIVNLEEYQSSLDIEFPDIFTIDEFESMRKKKTKLRTICNVYEKQFYIFKRNIGKEWRTFDIAYWINEMDNNIIAKNCNQFIIFETNLEIKFDDEETRQSYQDYLQKIEQYLTQKYEKEDLIIKYEHTILIGNNEIPTYVKTKHDIKPKAFFDITFLCIVLSFPIIPFVLNLFKNKLPEHWNIICWFYLSKHKFEFVTRISNKNLTVIS